MLRICRDSQIAFAHDIERTDAVHTEDRLKRIAPVGFHAAWLCGVYRQILTNSRHPKFGKESAMLVCNIEARGGQLMREKLHMLKDHPQ